MRNTRIIIFSLFGIALTGLAIVLVVRIIHAPTSFNGQRAYQDVLTQVAFGPRITGSRAHTETIRYIETEAKKAGWKTQIQVTTWQGFPVENIKASNSNQVPQIILGAHYDSRMVADQDPGPGRDLPVPGANDGASGVAVLLELARTLHSFSTPLALVFLDAEDNGGLNGQDWIMGSRAYVASLDFHPRAVIILDMIGDADLNIYMERNSDQRLVTEIWAQAALLGYRQYFIPTYKYSMIDDHTPFLEAGIPAVDIIDFDYPYWHTTADTPDKVSAASLQIVGEVLRAWLLTQK
jgi:Zn-dependent M28 family amino/carboxypeptidase